MVDLDIAFMDSANWNEKDMLARMKWMRENDPVHWSEKDQCWLVSRYADVEYCSKHQDLFTSAFGVRPGSPVKIGLIDEEEPRHGQLRALINRGFTPRMVNRLEQIFRDLTVEHVDAVAAAGECDFVQAVSVPLPLKLIAAMIGIRREDYDTFHRWSDAMILAEGRMGEPEVMARAATAYMEYATYVTAVIEDRRANPRDDLVSILTGAKDRGLLREYDERVGFETASEANMHLANDELIKLLVILLVAGNETTRNGISGGMQLLIENPGQRRKLAEDPSLLKGAVEEMVRLASPVRSFGRTVVRDTELGGKQLRAGQSLLMLYPSANRDEEVFEAADEFRVDRNPHHLGFGVGSHYCLGANLARMEMRVVFDEILRRLPDMEYAAGGPVLHPSALVRSCVEMRVRYTPERRAAA